MEAKVALVTGSSSGIGEATVKLLAEKGYRVVVTGSRKEKVDRVAAECAKLSPQKLQPLALVADFSKPENGEEVVRKTIEHFGQLDVLVNNAGIFCRSNPDDPTSYDLYRQVMSVNLDATVKVTLAAVEHLRKSKGTIVFVSSVASTKASRMGYAYCMSKSAMSMFAKVLAIDLAPDVRVNIVSPGPVDTPIFERVGLTNEVVHAIMSVSTLQERIGKSREIADAIYFLISDSSSFVLGHELFIDGGYMLKPAPTSAAEAIIAAKKAAGVE